MSRYAKLIYVSADGVVNSNKFYEMREVGSDLVVTYGRVGGSSQTRKYSIRNWDSKYGEKIRKGYKDVTHLQVTSVSHHEFADVADPDVSSLLGVLTARSRQTVRHNYNVSAGAVTQMQIDEADRIISDLSRQVMLDLRSDRFNRSLQDLFITIPRRMHDVREYLLVGGREDARKIVDREQATLDAMRGQVSIETKLQQNQDDKKTLLDALGVTIVPASSDERTQVIGMMGDRGSRLGRLYRVSSPLRHKSWEEHVGASESQESRLMWHGSRTENWLTILETGLRIRPSNAISQGAMYGYGIYFSDLCKKAMGYTSLPEAYWTRESDSIGFVGLYNVHTGNSLVVHRRIKSEHGAMTWEKLRRKGNYHSLHAPAGTSVINPETIVYQEKQSTIAYLAEVGK